jgi:Protein of unknown function DUF262
MTYQTREPVRDMRMNVSALTWGDLTRQVQADELTYDLPYQRGAVWTAGQRIMLVYSILAGTPVAALILNHRPWDKVIAADGTQLPSAAVVDGKQRLMTFRMLMEGDLAVPASWFPADRVTATEATGDGPYVRYPGLTRPAQRFLETTAVPAAEANVTTIAEEAAIYLRVNGSGTPQTSEDIARAAGIAKGRL